MHCCQNALFAPEYYNGDGVQQVSTLLSCLQH